MFSWIKRTAHDVFMNIAEPRIIRLIQFGVYMCMLIAGTGLLANPPRNFEGVIGLTMVYVFGGFIFVGALFGAIAVLPGFWWFERVGIMLLITGLFIYTIIILALGASLMGVVVAVAFILTFAQRWQEIKRFQLAPREG